ncbi:MAG: T9SS type A sorting domain-containing protein, partial [Bacteroidota bacterium]
YNTTDVYAQRYSADGSAQGSVIQVSPAAGGTQQADGDPVVTMDADGDFIVVYTKEYYAGGAPFDVYLRRYAADGTALSGQTLVHDATTNNQQVPSVSADADGDFVVVWQETTRDGSGTGVFGQRYAADGTESGAEFQVNDYTTNGQNTPVVALDASGGFVVAWAGEGTGDGAGVFARRYDASGASQNPEVTFALDLAGAPGWRMLAQPSGTTIGALLNPLWTQGVPGADAAQDEPTAANVFVYDETDPTADEDVGFTPVTTLNTALPSGQGFIVYVFADDDFDGTPDPFPKALSVEGYTAPSGTVSPAMSFTNSGTPSADGWNLLGNVFAEPLDWDAVRANGGFDNVEATVYVWDPASNAYRTYNGSSGDLLGGQIAGGQGFFVKATAASPAVPFASDDTGAIGGVYTVYSRIGTPVKLAFELTTGVGEARAFVEAGFGGEQARDRKDGYLLSPLAATFAQLYTRPVSETAEAAPLAINSLSLGALSEATSPVAIPLGVAAFEAGLPMGGAMTLRWPKVVLPDGWRAELRDTQTGAVVNLSEATEYAFTLGPNAAPETPDSNPAKTLGQHVEGAQMLPPLLQAGVTDPVAKVATGSERFELVLTPASVVAAEGDEALPEALTLGGNYPNPFSDETTLRYGLPEAATVRVAVYDVLGREVLVVQDGPQQAGWHTLGVDAARLASGLYVWRVEATMLSGPESQTGRMLVVK